jgi:hypothetical protein
MFGELKPCPFCSSENVEVQFCGIQHVAVVCTSCFAVGPKVPINKTKRVAASIKDAEARAEIVWDSREVGANG